MKRINVFGILAVLSLFVTSCACFSEMRDGNSSIAKDLAVGDSVFAAVKGGYAKGAVSSIEEKKVIVSFSLAEMKDSEKELKYSKIFLTKGSFTYNSESHKVGDVINVMYLSEGYSQTVLGTETPCEVIGVNSTKALMYYEDKGDYFEQAIESYKK